MELPESRLYTFIDRDREFALYFLEGQRLVHDVALVHPVHGPGFAYFRDVLLGIQPMIAFLKHDEQLGFYIDSEQPMFRLKIETSHHGGTRCTMLPEGFREIPEQVSGIARFLKVFPRRPPYESVLEIDGLPLREIVNRVLRDSYQTHAAVLVSEASDQSLLLHQLPPLPGKDEYEYSMEALRSRREALGQRVEKLFARALVGHDEIVAAFAEIDFRHLSNRRIGLECSCSKSRFVESLWRIHHEDEHQLFDPGQQFLEIVCEYCKKNYQVSRVDLEGSRKIN